MKNRNSIIKYLQQRTVILRVTYLKNQVLAMRVFLLDYLYLRLYLI